MSKQEFYTKEELDLWKQMKSITKPNKRTKFKDILKIETGFDILEPVKKHVEWLLHKGNEFKDIYNTGDFLSITPNEKGFKIEGLFREFCLERSLLLTERRGMRPYPDAQISQKIFDSCPYVEIKSFNSKNKRSALRAFYFSSIDGITRSTQHYMVGFELNNNNQIVEIHVVALNELLIKLRMEGIASYKDMWSL